MYCVPNALVSKQNQLAIEPAKCEFVAVHCKEENCAESEIRLQVQPCDLFVGALKVLEEVWIVCARIEISIAFLSFVIRKSNKTENPFR